jgi:hypothetical protein
MSLGASLVLFAIGAILTWGVTVQANGIDLDAVGVILMIVGIVGGLISAAFWMSWSPYGSSRTVVREQDHVHERYAEPEVHEVREVRERRIS